MPRFGSRHARAVEVDVEVADRDVGVVERRAEVVELVGEARLRHLRRGQAGPDVGPQGHVLQPGLASQGRGRGVEGVQAAQAGRQPVGERVALEQPLVDQVHALARAGPCVVGHLDAGDAGVRGIGVGEGRAVRRHGQGVVDPDRHVVLDAVALGRRCRTGSWRCSRRCPGPRCRSSRSRGSRSSPSRRRTGRWWDRVSRT